MNPPPPPIDLSQVPTWLKAGPTLLWFLAVIVFPLIQKLCAKLKVERGINISTGIQLTVTGFIGVLVYWLGVFIGARLTPETAAWLQPYWEAIPLLIPIVIGLQVVGVGVRTLKAEWAYRRDLRQLAIDERRAAIDERRARIKLLATPPNGRAVPVDGPVYG